MRHSPPSSLPNPDDLVDAVSTTKSDLVGGNARITVRRESPDDVGFREIVVSLDGRQAAILQANETFSIEVQAGHHRLCAHNTLFRTTHDLALRPGEHARFTAINKAGFCQFVCMIFLGASPLYLTFERDAAHAVQ